MIGNDDTATIRQILETVEFGAHAGQQEGGACRGGHEPPPPLQARHQHSHEK